MQSETREILATESSDHPCLTIVACESAASIPQLVDRLSHISAQLHVRDNAESALEAALLSTTPVVVITMAERAQHQNILRTLERISLSNNLDTFERIAPLLLIGDSDDNSAISEYQALGADICSSHFAEEVAFRAKQISWRLLQRKEAAFELHYDEHANLTVVLRGLTGRVQLDFDPRITDTFEIFATARSYITRQLLSDQLGVSLQTPKVHIPGHVNKDSGAM